MTIIYSPHMHTYPFPEWWQVLIDVMVLLQTLVPDQRPHHSRKLLHLTLEVVQLALGDRVVIVTHH